VELPSWMRSFDPHAAAKAAAADAQDPQLQLHKQQQAARQRAKATAGGGSASAPKPQQAHGSGAAAAGGGRQQLVDEDGTDLSEFLVANEGGGGGSKRRGGGISSSSEEEEGDRRGPRNPFASAPLPPVRKPQVIFCSRTHSQLSQFVGELHRTRFAETLTLVPVASRRALCVNEQAC